jgi:hypothetical protein
MDYDYATLRTTLQTMPYANRLRIVRHEMISSLAVIRACTDLLSQFDLRGSTTIHSAAPSDQTFYLESAILAQRQIMDVLDKHGDGMAGVNQTVDEQQIRMLCDEIAPQIAMLNGSADILVDIVINPDLPEHFGQLRDLLVRAVNHLRILADILEDTLPAVVRTS